MPQAVPPPAIVVTAPALPDPAAERAFDVQRFDRRELRDAPSTRLDQLLKQVPGLQLFRRSDSRSAHPTSQGVTLRGLGGNASSRALLVLDGVPRADPFGGWINWPAYDPAALSSVRVVRGGGSVAHGPGALAGTIEMLSALDLGVSAGIEAGSRQSLEARASAGLMPGLVVSARGGRSDGFVPVTRSTRGPADERADYRQMSLRSHFSRAVAAETTMQLSLGGFVDDRDRGIDFTANRSRGLDASARLVGRGSLPFSLLAYAQWRDFRSSFAAVAPGRVQASRASLQDEVPGRGLGGAIELRPSIGSAELRVGADVRHTSGESRELFSYVAGAPTRRRRGGGETLNAGGFAELAADVGRWTLSGGARLDHWQVSDGRLRERVIATGAVLRNDRFHDRSGWLPTARAGAVLRLAPAVTLRSAAYLGWRLPTLNELFRPFRAGADATAANPGLDPERLRGVELGASYAQGGFRIDATAFANRLSDAIANVTLGRGPGLFPGLGFVGSGGEYRQRRNLNAIRVRGIELAAEARRGAFGARAGYSLSDARVDADGPALALDGLRPAQTPRHSLVAALEWEQAGRALSLQLRRVGAQYEDDLNQRRLPAATTIDLFAAWPLIRDLQVVARGENLLDTRVVAGIAADGSVERATPRTLWLGLRFNRAGRPNP
jgi:outer membrane receptor protein involved in Fe transport